MIDYVKILLRDIDVQSLLNHPSLEFLTEVSEKTGELSSKKVAKFHFCEIIVHDKDVVLFKGSIHKLWNSLKNIKAPNYNGVRKDKGFNGNQFTINDIFEVRTRLEQLFECKPEQMVFQNIEFGVNTTPLVNINKYLKGLLYHKNKLFEYRFDRNLAQVEHQRYILKIYNKSNQYKMEYKVLRIELKVIKMEELKQIGVKTFKDVNGNSLDRAKELLLKRFDEVMHYDYTILKNKLSRGQKISLRDYSNALYWIDDLNPKYRDRHKKKLRGITNKYSDNIHRKIKQEMEEKCVIINRVSENLKCVIINPLDTRLNITNSSTNRNVLYVKP